MERDCCDYCGTLFDVSRATTFFDSQVSEECCDDEVFIVCPKDVSKAKADGWIPKEECE